MRHNWVWLLAGALIIASAAGCYPSVLAPAGETGAPPTAAHATMQSPPVGGIAGSITPTPPGETATRAWTAMPIAPVTPISTREEKMVAGVPIPTPLDPTLQKIVAQAQEDLAGRLRIDSSQVELVDVQSVVWPDGSLGCPQPGMAYIQVQVDGLLIRFKAGDSVYEYHSGGARPPFLCE
jgi:hypothetical protein